jgi:aminoglycoside 6'-N-acetyltransferase
MVTNTKMHLVAIGALLFLGFGGIAGGLDLLLDPSGAGVGFTSELLKDSPFDDYHLPGWFLLLGNGVFPLVAAFFSIRKPSMARRLVLLSGVYLSAWIALQVYWIGYKSVLQPIFGLHGLLLIGFSMLMKAKGPSFRLKLRPATQKDIPSLEKWDREPHVITATSDRENQEVALGDGQYWQDEIGQQTEHFQYYIAELAGRPIGAMLMIDPHLEHTHYWGEIEPNLRALDIWIGEKENLGKGYGEQMMRIAFQMCFADPQVKAIVIDPLNSNPRAHKFYQRLGFRPEGRRSFGEDDCLVHRLTRQNWAARFPEDSN